MADSWDGCFCFRVFFIGNALFIEALLSVSLMELELLWLTFFLLNSQFASYFLTWTYFLVQYPLKHVLIMQELVDFACLMIRVAVLSLFSINLVFSPKCLRVSFLLASSGTIACFILFRSLLVPFVIIFWDNCLLHSPSG